jgi:hypothetical protein
MILDQLRLRGEADVVSPLDARRESSGGVLIAIVAESDLARVVALSAAGVQNIPVPVK